MKISVIGPTYPYKGGISHYNTVLCQNLMKKHKVDVISFKRQYPKLLYPAESQKDLESKEKIDVKSNELIDSLNPFTWFKVAKRIKKFKPDIVLFYWWTPYFTFNFYTISCLVKKNSNAKVVFLCHNVMPHEKSFLDRMLTKIGLSKGDYFIVHAKSEKKNLLKIFPRAKVINHVHPTYEIFKEKNIEEDLSYLKLRKKIILFFGFVRDYKGLVYLLRAMPALIKKYNDLDLLIVGEFWRKAGEIWTKEKYVDEIKKLKIESHVKIIDKYIPNENVGNYFNIADVCVLPYLSGTNSGIVQTAFGFKKPVIVTGVGGLPEVVLDKKTGLVIKRENSDEIFKAVSYFYDNNKKEEFIKNIIKDKNRFSWDKLIKILEDIKDSKD
ncbi:MAG: glycosyltransferase [archaeon]